MNLNDLELCVCKHHAFKKQKVLCFKINKRPVIQVLSHDNKMKEKGSEIGLAKVLSVRTNGVSSHLCSLGVWVYEMYVSFRKYLFLMLSTIQAESCSQVCKTSFPYLLTYYRICSNTSLMFSSFFFFFQRIQEPN